MHDEPTARALKPDIRVVPPAIQVTAALVLRDEGHQHNFGALSIERPKSA